MDEDHVEEFKYLGQRCKFQRENKFIMVHYVQSKYNALKLVAVTLQNMEKFNKYEYFCNTLKI